MEANPGRRPSAQALMRKPVERNPPKAKERSQPMFGEGCDSKGKVAGQAQTKERDQSLFADGCLKGECLATGPHKAEMTGRGG